LEKAQLIITLDPNKKLSKICENHENENESVKEQEIKIDDDK
jgi:phage terminase large subunit-like protein